MIRKAEPADCRAVAALALQLWPEHCENELCREMEALLQRQDAAVFLLYDGNQPAGFAECRLRHDYVEGTGTSPVGYLEGIFVSESHRGRGGARSLLRSCEEWAKEKGCLEFASDCELANQESLQFHLSTGFLEANRVICFYKKL